MGTSYTVFVYRIVIIPVPGMRAHTWCAAGVGCIPAHPPGCYCCASVPLAVKKKLKKKTIKRGLGRSKSAALYCLTPTAYCLLPTAYCLLPVAYCLLCASSPVRILPPSCAASSGVLWLHPYSLPTPSLPLQRRLVDVRTRSVSQSVSQGVQHKSGGYSGWEGRSYGLWVGRISPCLGSSSRLTASSHCPLSSAAPTACVVTGPTPKRCSPK